MAMIDASQQPLAALGIGVYVVFILFVTKVPYEMMISRGVEHIRAVYYNRKIVHMMAGGIGSFSVPLLFTDVWYPAVCGSLLMVFTWFAHLSGNRLFWFQTDQN